jgi:AraC-like DNA-binding protein
MQAILRKIDSNDANSFVARTDRFSHFYNKWHFHPELELTYIIHGKGNRFIGDNIEVFDAGDLVLIGANLPHVWKNDSSYFEGRDDQIAMANVIQFLPKFFGETFYHLKELENIRLLFEKSQLGLRIEGATKKSVVKLMSQIFETDNSLKRLCILLEILETIAISDELKQLSSQGFVDAYQKFDTQKINNVYEFSLNQYHRKILIEEAAIVANMSVPNFCKYFKSRTQKTYIQFLTEVRIGFACRMMIENKKSIQQIAFDCGFHNLSNFNRSFRLLKNQKPAEYKQVFGGLKS